MTGVPEAVPPGLSWFAMQRLPLLLEAFEKEIEGVREAEDIEYIHRMRVASRRLRAALPLFRTCFLPKPYARWMQEITGITRALGEARDADVQIAFLIRYRKKSAIRWSAKNREATRGPDPLEPAIAYLLQELQGRRRQLQTRVLSALDKLAKSGVVGGMHAVFAARIAAAGRRTPVQPLAYEIPTVAALRIESRLAVMRSFTPWIPHADAVAEHHAMRIAAKKLRYTMEIYGPVYRLGLKKPHARVKRVQEILGDLHDCDVWIDHVTRLLLRERGRLRSEPGEKRPDTATLASLRLFLQDREHERIFLHRRFMRYWQSLENQKIWDEIRETLTSGRKARFIPGRSATDDEVRRACEDLAATWPEGLAHHRTVTRLALRLFDCLQPLHAMTGHDRLLLECAGMLHDIGWVDGTKRHNVRSARRIFAEGSLPLDMPDRIMAGLISEAHRGKVQTENHPLFPLLTAGAQETVLRLAAILRIADGLDCLHAGTVQECDCTASGPHVACVIGSTADVTREKERARSRSALFTRAFGRELVIS